MTHIQDLTIAHSLTKKSARGVRTSADFYHFYSLLTEEERMLCDRIRAFSDQEVIPIISSYWERGELPFELLPKLAKLDIAGDSIQGYGCPGIKRPAAGMAFAEIARGDAGVAAVLGASCLAMYAIDMYGSE